MTPEPVKPKTKRWEASYCTESWGVADDAPGLVGLGGDMVQYKLI
jgi:hypothetical protein